MANRLQQTGFTLIEVLVVVTISMVLVGFGIARYTQFLDKQSMVRSAEHLSTEIRGVQKMADAGERIHCHVGEKMDKSTAMTEAELYGYELRWLSASEMQVNELCDDDLSDTTANADRMAEVKTIGLTNDVTLEADFGSIVFPVLSNNLSLSGGQASIGLVSQSGSCEVSILVDEGGDVSIDDATLNCN